MTNLYILGIGRSGTTWLGDLVSLTNTPLKYLDEPFPKLRKDICFTFPNKDFFYRWFIPFNEWNFIKKNIKDLYTSFEKSNDSFRKEYLDHTLKRQDSDCSHLLIKDVHNLAIYPVLLENDPSARVVTITRDVRRVLDSYYRTFESNPYLISEFTYIKDCFKKNKSTGNKYIDQVLEELPKESKNFLSRFSFFQDDLRTRYLATEIINRYLILWANDDKRVMHITHEQLCQDTKTQTDRIYKHLGIQQREDTDKVLMKKTKGTSKGKFDTNKNSKEILNQNFKVLDEKMIRKVEKLNL